MKSILSPIYYLSECCSLPLEAATCKKCKAPSYLQYYLQYKKPATKFPAILSRLTLAPLYQANLTMGGGGGGGGWAGKGIDWEGVAVK